ncbi:hypothetical protein MD484_g8773, partial [Candolleomyces efflorescens]
MYMFTEWTKHLARGLDSGESDHIRKWLETPVDLTIGKWLRDGFEITQDTYKAFEMNVNLAFQTTRTKISYSGGMFTELQKLSISACDPLARHHAKIDPPQKVFEWIMLRNQHLREAANHPLRIRVAFREGEPIMGKKSANVLCNTV